MKREGESWETFDPPAKEDALLREDAMKRLICSTIIALGLAAPAFAQAPVSGDDIDGDYQNGSATGTVSPPGLDGDSIEGTVSPGGATVSGPGGDRGTPGAGE